jgi:hypothetical protein
MLEPLPNSQWTRRTADHLLSRAAFGGSPTQRETFYQLGKNSGVAAAVNSLIDPVVNWTAYPYPSWTQNEAGLQAAHTGFYAGPDFETWYMNQLLNVTPVAAKMMKFWVDHFASTSDMVMTDVARAYYPFDHVDRIRQNALGNIKTLTNTIYKGGLLIFMLDLHVSVAGSVNENFGRELMELFTLGVDGGYTEQDVAACAAAFTGHKLHYYTYPYSYFYNAAEADTSSKAFLGTTIVNGDDAMNAIFARVQCAKFLSWKIWRYFVSPNPSEALLQELALRLKDTYAYNVAGFLKDIFKSQEFYAAANIGTQIKDPADWIITATKSLGTTLLPRWTLDTVLGRTGYQPHRPPTVAGWPEPVGNGNLWLSTGNLLFRMNLPAIYTHKDGSLTNSAFESGVFPNLDFDAIAPRHLRKKSTFNVLLERLRQRLLPFHQLRGPQVRALYEAFIETVETDGELEAIKDVIRLMMALPEYQMQ